jgi:hypothetical protein
LKIEIKNATIEKYFGLDGIKATRARKSKFRQTKISQNHSVNASAKIIAQQVQVEQQGHDHELQSQHSSAEQGVEHCKGVDCDHKPMTRGGDCDGAQQDPSVLDCERPRRRAFEHQQGPTHPNYNQDLHLQQAHDPKSQSKCKASELNTKQLDPPNQVQAEVHLE